jgi:hypothetical protein
VPALALGDHLQRDPAALVDWRLRLLAEDLLADPTAPREIPEIRFADGPSGDSRSSSATARTSVIRFGPAADPAPGDMMAGDA